MVYILLSGINLLLGLESPENIEGGDHHAPRGYAYSNWVVVPLTIGLFSFFKLSFLAPAKKRDCRTLGLYEAFIIALFRHTSQRQFYAHSDKLAQQAGLMRCAR